MNTLKLLDDIRARELYPFFAPVLDWKGKVLSIQHDLPYWWKLKTANSHMYANLSKMSRFHRPPTFPKRGWYEFKPDVKTGTARKMNISAIDEIQMRHTFLGKLTVMHVITLFPLGEMTWLVTPFNLSDAGQRGWSRGKPRRIHLVDHNISSGKVVAARVFGNTLLFDERDANAREVPPTALAHANNIIQTRIDEIHKEQEELERKEKLKTVEGRIGASLEFMGATLKSWSKNLTGYNVSWELDGTTYSMEIDANMRIDSAGVCLAGTDGWHSLASVVAVMEERR